MKIFALVGKPNVGKSTLFNRLARRRIAIVNKTPGVTRDRNTEVINFKGFNFVLVDTGGFEPKSKEIIPQKMKEQSQLAVEEADGIIFLLDQESGWTNQDQDIYDYLRRSHKPIYFTVNKVDNPKHELKVAEFYESGVDQVFAISGEHGMGVVDLLEHISEDFPEINQLEEGLDQETDMLSVAIVGRPNAGKSSLTNHFLGKNKQIVDETPGTTRDPVDNICKFHGESIRLIDTAGIKRKSRVSLLIDKYSMIAAIKSIERSDVVLLTIDATEGIVEQDLRIAGYIVERGKALVIVINKWDLVEKDNKTLEKMREEVYLQMPFITFAPIVFVSAKSGQRVHAIMSKVKDVYQQYTKRIQTSDLNNIIQIMTERHTPPVKNGRATKIFYASQVSIKPPTFAIISNQPKAINISYQRYVMKQFRHYFSFEGTPLKIFWREKSKKINPKEPS
jgi:GTPase